MTRVLSGADERVMPVSRERALAALPPVVYAVRVGETIKLGHTTDMSMRLRTLRYRNGADVELLAFTPGTLEDEQALHAGLTQHLAHGREYYRPSDAVLDVVNAMRSTLALPAVS